MLVICGAQVPKRTPAHSEHLPYTFSNFVWWSDDELRVLVKSRILGLGDEIAPGSSIEHKIRDVLTLILKQKGIVAEVQSVEPSTFSPTAEHALGSPVPAIVYNILSPQFSLKK